jgi:hypothetical protein
MISTDLIIKTSFVFVVGQVWIYQILFDKFFQKRFKLFNDSVKKYILEDTSKLIKELKSLKSKKSIGAIIDIINDRAILLEDINNLSEKLVDLSKSATYSYILFGVTFALACLVQRPFLFSFTLTTVGTIDTLDILFMLSVLFMLYLGYKFFNLNEMITRYEKDGSLYEIIERIKEEYEED